MALKIRAKIQTFQQRLTRLDQQALSKASLVIVLFLDLFILSSIFDGLTAHTAQLTRPDEHVPSLCREVILDETWTPTNRLERLAQWVANYHNDYFFPDTVAESKPVHTLCASLMNEFSGIRNDKALSNSLRELVKIKNEINELNGALARNKGAYDTALLETLAKDETAKERVVALRPDVNGKTKSMDELTKRQSLLIESLQTDAKVKIFFANIEQVNDAERDALRAELRELNFWFPVKRLAWETLFLLPLFFVFYVWNTRSIKHNKSLQVLVSSHLLVVVTIPAFCKLLEMVYDIIPHKLLSQLFELLVSLHLVAIWHYVMMVLAIASALALIYVFQRKLFSQEKLMQRRIARALCQHCGVRLLSTARHCTACGGDQLTSCKHCHSLTPLFGNYCQCCGQSCRG